MAEVEAYASQPCDAAAGIYTETLARLYLKQGFVRTRSGYLSPFSPRAARQSSAPRASAHLGTGTGQGGGGPDPAVQGAAPDAAGESAAPVTTPSRAPDCRAARTVVTLSATSASAARTLLERQR